MDFNIPKNVPLFDKAVVLLLLLTQILKTYGYVSYWNFASIPTYLCLLIFVVMVLLGKRKINHAMPKELWWFFGYWFLVYIFNNSVGDIVVSNVVLAALSFALFWGVVTPSIFPLLIKYYRYIAYICIGFFFLQEFSYYTTGHRISGIISSLPIALNSVTDSSDFIANKILGDRGGSFFSEPAYFAQYIVPLFAIELFILKDRLHYFRAGLVAFSCVASLSGTGIVALLVVFGVYVISLMKGRSTLSKVGVVTIFIFGYVFLLNFQDTKIGEKFLDRQDELSLEYESGSRSGFMRLYRGYYVYDDYSWIEKIFGVDNKSRIEDHINNSVFSYTFAENNDTFFNGVQYTLLRTGMIGLAIMIMLIIAICRKNNYCGTAIALMFVSLMLSEAIFFGNNMVLYLIMAERFKYFNF